MSARITRIPALRLESGRLLRDVPVAWRSWGQLDASGSNAVVVCHALTGDADADQWWPGLLGPGRAIDTHRYFVVCANVIGSPYGSLSPLSTNPDTGRRWGADFPAVTVRDTISLHRALLEMLGVRRVAFAIGGSMGGMQVLEWGWHRDLVQALVPIAVGGRHSAWCIAWSEAQRQAIYADPNWLDGHYSPERPPAAGLAVARMMGMVSYRSYESFAERFGREPADPGSGADYQVESYLRHQGQRLVARFDANCYVELTRLMDTHDVSRGRGTYAEALARITQPALVIGITTDVLYPLQEQRELATGLPNAELAVLDAPQGHDAFLIEQQTLAGLVADWRERVVDPVL